MHQFSRNRKIPKGKIIYKNHNTLLEIVWTFIPAAVLVSIAIPSFNLLYFNQTEINASYNIRVTASQWYWSYSYPCKFSNNHKVCGIETSFYENSMSKILLTPQLEGQELEHKNNLEWLRSSFKKDKINGLLKNSNWWVFQENWIDPASSKNKYETEYMTFCADLLEITSKKMELSFDSNLYSIDNGIFRLLEVDNRLILPRNTHIRFVITSNDVLHSWSIPSLGIKVDACPGRLNEVSAVVYRNSVFYGQCSEICGVLHGFMPIVIQTVNYLDFLKLQYLIVICSHYNS